jgi:F0F1-type ATP synthase assembly protein I
MAINPRHVPWMTLLGVIGMAAGYGIGHLLARPDPIVPAFWGLCGGTLAGLGLRFVLTLRWAREQRGQANDTSGGARPDA